MTDRELLEAAAPPAAPSSAWGAGMSTSREEIEKWARRQSMQLEAFGDRYWHAESRWAFDGWSARDAELAALRAECERLRKDAERYRWLRDWSPKEWELKVAGLLCWKFDYNTAIDTAMTDPKPAAPTSAGGEAG